MAYDTEKMLEEYKTDVAESEKADYEALTPEEKTAWLRCDCESHLSVSEINVLLFRHSPTR